jgi:hypothetical protein
MIRPVLVLLMVSCLSGCASLWFAGVSDYQVTMPDGVVISIYSGKQEQSVEATLSTTDTGYDITLKENGVEAFKGQAIAGAAASDAVAAGAAAAISALKTIK